MTILIKAILKLGIIFKHKGNNLKTLNDLGNDTPMLTQYTALNLSP